MNPPEGFWEGVFAAEMVQGAERTCSDERLGWYCTVGKGHTGPHVAHGLGICAAWPDGSEFIWEEADEERLTMRGDGTVIGVRSVWAGEQ